MGVFLTDRHTAEVLGLPNVLWMLLGQSLAALGAPQLDRAFVRDGYIPSWLGRAWGELLFNGLGDLVVVCRPATGHSAELRPVAVYRQGSPVSLGWARHGEQLSMYDLPCTPRVLRYAQFCTAGTGHSATTLRPAIGGTPRSEVAARVLHARSGLFPAATDGRVRPPTAPQMNPRTTPRTAPQEARTAP